MEGCNCLVWVQQSGSPIMNYSPHLSHLVVSLNNMTENNLLLQIFSLKCQGWVEKVCTVHCVNFILRVPVSQSGTVVESAMKRALNRYQSKVRDSRWIVQVDDPSGFIKRWNDVRKESLVRFKPKFLFLPWNHTNYVTGLFHSPELDHISDVVAAEIPSNRCKSKVEQSWTWSFGWFDSFMNAFIHLSNYVLSSFIWHSRSRLQAWCIFY